MPKDLDIIVSHISNLELSIVQEAAVIIALLAAFKAGQQAEQ